MSSLAYLTTLTAIKWGWDENSYLERRLGRLRPRNLRVGLQARTVGGTMSVRPGPVNTEPSIVFQRADYNTATDVLVKFVVGVQQYRRMVRIPDDASPALVGARLKALGNWCEGLNP